MRVLYFDPCEQDGVEFSCLFTSLQSQRKISVHDRLIVASDTQTLVEKVRKNRGFEVGFVDFYVADEFQKSSVVAVLRLRQEGFKSEIYGYGFSEQRTCTPINDSINELLQEKLIASEIMYKETSQLQPRVESILERYSRAVPFTTKSRIMHLVQ